MLAPKIGFEHETLKEIEEARLRFFQSSGLPGVTDLEKYHRGYGRNLFHGRGRLWLSAEFSFLKTAHRVLVRVKKFECTHFNRLHQYLSQIRLEAFGDQKFELQVAAQKSKLNNEKRIIEVAQQIWKGRIVDKSSLSLLIRADQDVFTVSLDTSGEHLHKRGWRKNIGEAPLRETSAQFMLRNLRGEDSLQSQSDVTLLDPFCGSGTILVEAAPAIGARSSAALFIPRMEKASASIFAKVFCPHI